MLRSLKLAFRRQHYKVTPFSNGFYYGFAGRNIGRVVVEADRAVCEDWRSGKKLVVMAGVKATG